MRDLSLATLLSKSPMVAERLVRGKAEIKKSKEILKNNAREYFEKNKQEVLEGTEKMKLLLEDGKRNGLSEEEVYQNTGFIPTIHTPILNWLHWMVTEQPSQLRENERELLNEESVRLRHSEDIELNIPRFDEYLYGNMTHDTFAKIKKLKTLSLSNNEHEAKNAYWTAKKMCDKYGLDFDKIPVNK